MVRGAHIIGSPMDKFSLRGDEELPMFPSGPGIDFLRCLKVGVEIGIFIPVSLFLESWVIIPGITLVINCGSPLVLGYPGPVRVALPGGSTLYRIRLTLGIYPFPMSDLTIDLLIIPIRIEIA